MRLFTALILIALLTLACGKDDTQQEVLVGRAWQLTTHQASDEVNQPQWSPDGTKIAYRARQNVWYVEVVEGIIRPTWITRWSGVNEYPHWHPTASENKVCFLQQYMGKYRLYVAPVEEDVNVADATMVYETDNQIKYASFTRDGSRILYFRLWIASDSTNLVWTMPIAAGGEPTPITNSEGWTMLYDLQTIPSSDDIMYIDRRGQTPLYYYNIKLLPLAGGSPVNLTGYSEGSPFSIGGVAMSYDGKKLAFTMQDSRTGSFIPNLWTMDIATGEMTQITTDSFNIVSSPAWSPDGKRIAVIKYKNIFIIELEE